MSMNIYLLGFHLPHCVASRPVQRKDFLANCLLQPHLSEGPPSLSHELNGAPSILGPADEIQSLTGWRLNHGSTTFSQCDLAQFINTLEYHFPPLLWSKSEIRSIPKRPHTVPGPQQTCRKYRFPTAFIFLLPRRDEHVKLQYKEISLYGGNFRTLCLVEKVF